LGLIELTGMAKIVKQPATMKLEGRLMEIHVQVLVDSGASHCFIHSKAATALGLVVEKNAVLGVKLGDGHRVTTVGKCRNIEIQLGNFTTRINAYVLELGDLDVILGAAWMRMFGKVTFDWDHMILSFPCNGKIVELQRVKSFTEVSN